MSSDQPIDNADPVEQGHERLWQCLRDLASEEWEVKFPPSTLHVRDVAQSALDRIEELERERLENEPDAKRYLWVVAHAPNTIASIALGRACATQDETARVNELVDEAIRQSENE